MSALKKIELGGYKSIRSMSLDLLPINVLIGANGVGKSNFLSFFKLLSSLVAGKLQDFVASQGGADAMLFNSRQTSQSVEAKLDFGENLYEFSLAPDSDDSLYFVSEVALVWDRLKFPRPYDEQLGSGHRESSLITSKLPVASYVREKMSRWTLYHFHDTSASAKVKQSTKVDDNEKLAQDARNLPAFLLLLKETESAAYRQIVEVIRLAAPFFEDFVLRPNPRNRDLIRLEWNQRNSNAIFGASDLSDGTLRFICLATALLQPTPPSVILIDEPELGLHPYAIALLASLIRKTSEQCQLIISTQSVPLVNQFVPEDAVIVERHDESSTFFRVSSDEFSDWLDDYGLGDLWEKNVIGGRPTYA